MISGGIFFTENYHRVVDKFLPKLFFYFICGPFGWFLSIIGFIVYAIQYIYIHLQIEKWMFKPNTKPDND
jgi:ATP/ADP translocase